MKRNYWRQLAAQHFITVLLKKKREKTSPFSIYFNLLGYLTSEIGKLKKAKFIVYLLLSFFHISFSSGLRVSIL